MSADHTEFQIKDRLSFMRFLGLDLEDPVPDAKTLWLFRDTLARKGAIDKLFRKFNDFRICFRRVDADFFCICGR